MPAAIPFVAQLVVSFIITRAISALAKKPKRIESPGLTRTINQAASPRHVVYGERLMGGVVFFMHTTFSPQPEPGEGESVGVIRNHYLHMAVDFAGHEIDGFVKTFLNDEAVPLAPFGGADDFLIAAGGRYSEFLSGSSFHPLPFDERQTFACRKLLGGPDQVADPRMLAIQAELDPDFPGTLWTAEHRAREHAYVYYRFGWNQTVYPNGIPNPTEVIRGRKLFDPRIGATLWSNNPALVIRDFLLDAKYGFGAAAGEIDDAEVIAAANVCDEQVAVASRSVQVTADVAGDSLTGADPDSRFRLYRGMVARISSSGTPPAPLLAATDYYVIRDGLSRWQLAVDLADARAGAAIALTDAGTGDHTLTAVSELRYTCDGEYDTATEREGVLRGFVGSMAGRVVNSGGQWRIFAGAWRAPTAPTLDESDLAGPITIQWRHKRRDLFNAVKGTYVGPDADWTEDDFPVVTNALYQAQDNGERRWGDIELPFTQSPSTAQRIAKIELETNRQQITFQARFKLTALQLVAGDTVPIDNAKYGWSGKLFEVENWSFAEQDGAGGGPALVIDAVLRETAAAVYDWNSGEETARDLAPDSSVPSALDPDPPGAPIVVEQLYQGRDGGGVKVKAAVSWAAAADAFAKRYELDFKLAAASDWLPGGRVTADQLAVDVLDLDPGIYDFRVRMINSLEVASAYAQTPGFEIFGLPAPPATPTGVTISAVSQLALIRWDLHPDLDVRVGGKIVFRHTPLATGAQWEQSVSIGDPFQGNETIAVLPLKAGSYLMKAIDGSGTPSLGFATVTTAGASILAVAQVGQLVEQPAFAGSHGNTVGVAGKLKLDGVGQFDAIADFDLVPDLDDFGGTFTSGTYGFSAVLDLRAGNTVRLESMIDVVVFNKTDLWDDRTALMDSWEDVDGNQAGITGDAVVFVSRTADDPAGSPVWGPWERLDVAEFEAGAFRFEARLAVDDPAYNIEISTLEITASEAA
jgi:hypothetical protein